MDLMAIRARLIRERDDRDWTQTQLAHRAGVTQGQISRYEDLSQPLEDWSARILFAVIERGFGFTASIFLAEIEGSRSSDLNAAAKSDNHDATPQMVMPDVDARAQLSDGVPQAILGLAGSLNDRFDATAAAIDRLADRLEQIAAPRRAKTLRRPRAGDRRKKVG